MSFSKVQFSWAVDDFVAFVFVNDQNLSRAAVTEYLLQRGNHRHSSTPHQMNTLVKDAVQLGSIQVSCRPSGCMSCTGRHAEADSCLYCARARYRPASTVPTRVMPY